MDLLAPLFALDRQTDIPLIFRGKTFWRHAGKPLWVSLIGPSGAGKDTIKNRLLHTGKFFYIRTATNRHPRSDENPRDYIWMRAQYENEPLPAYLRSLIKQYDLFEYNFHYGNMYGTPLESIKNAVVSKKIPLYCSENQGAAFVERTLSSLFDIMTVSIIPDSLEDMERRILSGSRNNPTKRLAESLDRVRTAGQAAHFIVKNPSSPVESGKSGLESAVAAVRKLISSFA